MMRSDLLLALIVGVLLLLLLIRSRWLGRSGQATPAVTKPPRAPRAPKPLAGLTRTPDCPACEQAAGVQPAASAPHAPPPHLTFPRGRRRYVDPSSPCCPHAPWAYQGRVGWGNLRANGHPRGRRWRPLGGRRCQRHGWETHGTPGHGKQGEPDKLVWAIAALAEGLGIRAVARVFGGDPNTGLGWLVEAAEHLEAFSRSVWPDVDVEPGPLAELGAVLSAVQDGAVTEAAAIQRLARSPHWVWGAMDPVCKLRLAGDVGERPLALAPRLVPQVTQGLGPGHAGCPGPGGSRRRWCQPTGDGGSGGGNTALSAARHRPSSPAWPSPGGSAIRAGSHASSGMFASLGRRSGGAATPGAHTQPDCGSSGRSALCSIIACGPTRADVGPYPSLSMGRAQANSGNHGHRQWPPL